VKDPPVGPQWAEAECRHAHGYDHEVPSTADVFTFDPRQPPAGHNGASGPSLLWAAPGSLFAPQVANAWARKSQLADLGSVTGPWAVVLWDPVTACHVLAADPVGVQPLFCARTTQGTVAVASHLAALVDRPDVDDTIDPEGVLLELVNAATPDVAHRTPFTSVRRIPWGCALEVHPDNRWRQVRYWDPTSLPGPDNTLSLNECADMLGERIDAAISRLLPADGLGVGAHVSSGLDCTAVACRANQLLNQQGTSLVAGYSWAPDEATVPRGEHDERTLIDDVKAQEGFTVRMLADNDDGQWFDALDPCRYPTSTHLRESRVLPRAHADGVSVMLSGWGGDELASFNGRAVMTHLVRTGQWHQVWRHTSARVRVRTDQPPARSALARSFIAEVRSALRPVRGPLARPTTTRQRDDDALRAISPLAADHAKNRHAALATATDHHSYQLALLHNGHMQNRCGWWYQTGQLHGIDYRYPLLDLHVVTAALQLPWWAYRSQGWNRLAYRKAVTGWVPGSVAWNILKNEPALTTQLANTRNTTTTAVQRRRPTGDDTYQQLVDAARIVNSPASTAQRAPEVILTRPDAAPL